MFHSEDIHPEVRVEIKQQLEKAGYVGYKFCKKGNVANLLTSRVNVVCKLGKDGKAPYAAFSVKNMLVELKGIWMMGPNEALQTILPGCSWHNL